VGKDNYLRQPAAWTLEYNDSDVTYPTTPTEGDVDNNVDNDIDDDGHSFFQSGSEFEVLVPSSSSRVRL
jgi:hypothetical protein